MAKLLRDRITRAFLAGVAGGVLKDLLDMTIYYTIHTTYRYLDFAAMIIYGRRPKFWWDTIFAQFVELIFAGYLAVPFAYWVPQNKENYVLKGWLYGVAAWLFLCTIGMIYKTPFFTRTPWPTTNSDFVTSSIYGLAMAAVLLRLDKKYGTV